MTRMAGQGQAALRRSRTLLPQRKSALLRRKAAGPTIHDIEVAARKSRRDTWRRLLLMGALSVEIVIAVVGAAALARGDKNLTLATFRAGARLIDRALAESLVTTVAQVVAGVTVAVIVAPRVGDHTDPYDRVSLARWLRAAAGTVQVVSSVAVAVALLMLFALGTHGAAAPGWLLLPTAILSALLAGFTGMRAQDSADTGELERATHRLEVRLAALTSAQVTTSISYRRLALRFGGGVVAGCAVVAGYAMLGNPTNARGNATLALIGAVLLAPFSGLLSGFLDAFRVWLMTRGHQTAARALLVSLFAFPVLLLAGEPVADVVSPDLQAPVPILIMFLGQSLGVGSLGYCATFLRKRGSGVPMRARGYAPVYRWDVQESLDRLRVQQTERFTRALGR